jgi:hypothetical protein
MLTETCPEEIILETLSSWQQATIANFLQVSRLHFGLGHNRTGYWSRRTGACRTMVKSLLIAGTIGAQVGDAAYADPAVTRTAETRTDREAPNRASSAVEEWRRSPTPAEMHGGHAHEVHEQFVRRASRVFPEDQVSAWSRIDRAVFNHLMSQLIFRHSYGEISNEMLHKVRTAMIRIVKGLTGS